MCLADSDHVNKKESVVTVLNLLPVQITCFTQYKILKLWEYRVVFTYSGRVFT